ncbi:hypothetical protein ACIOZM_06840 [Pseudomonas sp. NPDC087346]|uniref:hypothetical protein n=1 Tax=Pseudomonas sp. NPDC087346 TaxID=3364438 RepID=UPI0037FEC187
MHCYTIQYVFNGEPRTHKLELKQSELTTQDAAMHLLQLHLGDAENSLIMPTADSTPEEVLEQADLVGISQITVVSVEGE